MRLVLLALFIGTGWAHAGPLGPLWSEKVGASCVGRYDAPGGLLVTGTAGKASFHDGATGAATKLVVPKDQYGSALVGDTLVITGGAAVAGTDRKTGAEKWRRARASKERGSQRAVVAGGDVVIADYAFTTPITVGIERLDAATGKTKWKANVPTKRERFWELVATANRVYVVTETREPKAYSIAAFDAAGKVVWTTDDVAGFLPAFSAHGEDVITIENNAVRVHAAATGKGGTPWTLYHNASPVYFDGAVYATPVDRSVEARDPSTGKTRWTTQLPANEATPNVKVIGVSRGVVYVQDGEQLRSLDAKTGNLLASYGVAGGQTLRVHAATPAVTFCEGQTLVALDPSSPKTAERRLKITGRVQCKNCPADEKIAVQVGDAVAIVGADRKLVLEVSGRGKHSVTVRNAASSGRAREAKVVTFDADRTLNLGVLRVVVPEPGDDRTYHP